MSLCLRPVTDSYGDFFAIKQMYDEWKQCDTKFTFPLFVNYIRQLVNTNCILFVIQNKSNQIVGSCKVILEPKLAFCNWVCHIEDVVVKNEFRGLGIGSFMMQSIIEISKKNRWADSMIVYKVRLGCKDSLESFYEKSQFTRSGSDMVYYIDTNKT